jgi:succinyl-diaminopimelate desuccinylase
MSKNNQPTIYEADIALQATGSFETDKLIADERPLSNIINLSKELIALRSTKDNIPAIHDALDRIKQELQGHYPIEEFESNGLRSILVHNTRATRRDFKIILNAHLDVVPAKDEQFQPHIEGDKLYGRGAYDMKAATAVMVYLFKNLANRLPYPLALQIVTDEESMGTYSTKYQIDQGLRAEFVISGENSGLHIKNMTKGMLWFKLHATGITGHGGYPWRGKNALWKLHDALDKIKKLYPVPDDEVWATTVNLARIETPTIVFNQIPDQATALFDVRFIPQDKKTILENIRNAVEPEVEVEVEAYDSSQYADPENKYVQILQKSVEDITQRKSDLIYSHAASDIRLYNAIDIDGVEFGPDGAGQHSDHEWVSIKSLEEYYFILEKFLLESINQ